MLAIANYTAGAASCLSSNHKLVFVYSSTATPIVARTAIAIATATARLRLRRLNSLLQPGRAAWRRDSPSPIRRTSSSSNLNLLASPHHPTCLVAIGSVTVTTVGVVNHQDQATKFHASYRPYLPPRNFNRFSSLPNGLVNVATMISLAQAVAPLSSRHGRTSISIVKNPVVARSNIMGRDSSPMLMSSSKSTTTRTMTRAYAPESTYNTAASNNWVRHKTTPNTSSIYHHHNNNNNNNHSWKVQQWNEDDMVYRKTVYDHCDWKRHRSNTRHSRHMAAIASSRVAAGLLPPVFKLTLMASLLVLYNMWAVSAASQYLLRVPSLPFQLAAPAVALLLVFRTNASYGRFDEARKAWASIVNRARDMARQSVIFFQHPTDAAKLRYLLRYLVSFPYCLKDHLTHEDDLRKELREIMLNDDEGDDHEDDLNAIMSSPHRPNYILQVITQFIHNSHLTDMQKALLDANVTSLHDNVGVCERIFSTPIPVSYTRLTSRILVIWHLLLPLVLWEQCTWVTIPATFLSATIFFCIEEVGVLIEEPFSILPLGNISNTIRQSVDEIRHQQRELSEKVKFSKTR